VRLKRLYISLRLSYPDVNDGRVPVTREEDLPCKGLGQARGVGYIVANDAYFPGKLCDSG